MKFCRNCGNGADDDTNFCGFCGASMKEENRAENTADVIGTVGAADENISAEDDGSKGIDRANTVNNACNGVESGTNYEMQYETAAEDVKKKPKKKKRILLRVFLAIIALILVAAIVLGVLIMPYFGPAAHMSIAAARTFEAESFSFYYTKETKYVSAVYDGTVVFDIEKQELQMYVEVTSTEHDSDEEYVSESVIGIYDGIYFEYDVEEDEGYSRDVSNWIERFFEFYSRKGEFVSLKGIEWDDLLKEIEINEEPLERSDVEKYVDLEKVNTSLKETWKSFNSKKWLKENLNYEKERKSGVTYYSFIPDYNNLFKSLGELFEDSIVDEEIAEIFSQTVDEMAKLEEDPEMEAEITVGIDNFYLNEINIEIGNEKYSVKFDNIGKVSFDGEDLKPYIEKCEQD
ncbi:MAG: zinc ribbon domain-containing protein [Clostridia bacterium]|nr:zinc ribbon domain-containing protein [Clostridia bacterium]